MLLEAIIFTIGCSILVTNACLCFLPYISPSFKFPIGVVYVEGILSVLSCTLFFTGSVFTFLEAVKAKREGCFGWKLNETPRNEYVDADVEKGCPNLEAIPTAHHMQYHYNSSHENLVGYAREFAVEYSDEKRNKAQGMTYTRKDQDQRPSVATSHEVWTCYLCDLGFVANAIALSSSSVYCGTSVISLIMVLSLGIIERWIRYPQLVAAIGFAVSSAIMMFKTQRRWWCPALYALGWHINFWNLVGSAGFIFCALFGLLENAYWAEFQFGCSYLWGSWAMLLGSVISWYKAQHKLYQTTEKSREFG